MTYTETEQALAKAFDVQLRLDIGAFNYAEVRRRNLRPDYACACASHDFCDANMTMLDAYQRVTGWEFPECDEQAESDMDTWNRAWQAWREMTGGRA